MDELERLAKETDELATKNLPPKRDGKNDYATAFRYFEREPA